MAASLPPESAPIVSQQLHEANQRLLQRRRQRQASRPAGSPSPDPAPTPSQTAPTGRAGTLPAHLGWESNSHTAALRAAEARRRREDGRAEAQQRTWLDATRPGPPPTNPEPPVQPDPPSPPTIKLQPDLALAMLRHEQAAAGRIWLLLRHLDGDGRGWISGQEARTRLTKKESGLRVCGWRQLRNLLRQGDGIFWERDDAPATEGRIWLRSTVKVAAALGLGRFQTRPVALPVPVLCAGVGAVRAHFYASFHSGRGEVENGPMPIARETLATVTGVPRRTQRVYERRANVDVDANYAIGERATKEAEQERAWRHGRGTFTFTDHTGKQGQKNETYIAWQLPNSYAGPHRPCGRSRQRQLNQELVDLHQEGGGAQAAAAGNGQGQREQTRRYYENGATAGRAYNRDASKDRYWQSSRPQGGGRMWHVLAGQAQ